MIRKTSAPRAAGVRVAGVAGGVAGALAIAAGMAFAAETPADKPATKPVKRAVAKLSPTAGNKASGTVTFENDGKNIKVKADLKGLTPGTHGFHIHEKGDCSAPDATSAGAHFNPGNAPHAGRDAKERHVGDLGNLEADDSGAAKAEFEDTHLTFDGDKSILKRAVIVHAKADDLKTQPTGDAGGRVACGVIEVE